MLIYFPGYLFLFSINPAIYDAVIYFPTIPESGHYHLCNVSTASTCGNPIINSMINNNWSNQT